MKRVASLLAAAALLTAAAPTPERTKAPATKAKAKAEEAPIADDEGGGDVPKIAPATKDAKDVDTQTYVVQPGDTLGRIVTKTGAGADAIIRENKLASADRIRVGQKLKIPAGRYHLVRKGERGIAIARAYGVEWQRIAELNHLEEPYLLRAGERLLIPSTREVADMSMEERAKAFHIDIDDLATGNEPALAPKAKPAPPVKTAARPVPASVPVAPPPPETFTGRFVWPLVGEIIRRYGPQPTGARNDGVNIRAQLGQTVKAAADGVVAYSGDLAGFGKLVLIRHGGGWLTAYGHAEKLLVTRGQAVKQGQSIAEAGATGSAREPQLHFEIRDGRKPVNPLDWLPKRD